MVKIYLERAGKGWSNPVYTFTSVPKAYWWSIVTLTTTGTAGVAVLTFDEVAFHPYRGLGDRLKLGEFGASGEIRAASPKL